jgi:RNA-directed DNA polymerase
MKKPDWFRPRGYLHFDVPVKVEYGEGLTPETVAAHAWSPLIHYIKTEKRYKIKERRTVPKERPIMFASHRDACILSKYSADLVTRLDAWYAAMRSAQRKHWRHRQSTNKPSACGSTSIRS